MNVWITGREGMIGSEVLKAFATLGGYTVFSTRRLDVDIANLGQVASAMQRAQPDVVINCAGITRGRNAPASEYMRTNAYGPQLLAEACDLWKARLIHVSSTGVFSGMISPQQRYSEVNDANPRDLHGRSMLAGEVTREPHLTVRTSVIGIGEHGLLGWLMQQEGKVAGFDRSYWNGITAPILAEIIYGLAGIPEMSGLLHVHSGKGITKHKLLQLLVDAFRLDIRVTQGPTPYDHIVNHCLASHRLGQLPLKIPPIEEQIEHLAERYHEWQAQQIVNEKMKETVPA